MLDVTNGYCAVVLPREGEYQGFFLRPDLDAQGQVALGRAARAYRESQGVDPSSEVLRHALAASLAECFLTRDVAGVAQLVHALRILTRESYFWVEAYPERDGTRTSIHPLTARDPDAARSAVKALPAVQIIEFRRALDALQGEAKGEA